MSCYESDTWVRDVAFFFVVFQEDTTKCDNKKTKTGIGVKGVKPAPIVFFYMLLSLRKSLIMPPKHAVMKFLEIKSPQNLTHR
jgi:hypothetical protein